MIKNILSSYRRKPFVSSQVSFINRHHYPKKPTSIDQFFSLIRKSDVEEINKGFAFYCSLQKGWEELKKEMLLKKNSMKPLLKFREISNIYFIYLASTRFLKIEKKYRPKRKAQGDNEFNERNDISIFPKNICQIAKDQNYETFKIFELLNADFNIKKNVFTKIFVNTTKEFCLEIKMGKISKRHPTNIKLKVCNKGNHTEFSEIHQILEVYSVDHSKQHSEKENFIYFQNSQVEIFRLYNQIFKDLFGNTSFFTFGMALHSYSFLENEAKNDIIQQNCPFRTKNGNNFYCLFQKIHPLNYLLNFILNSEKISAFNKFPVIKNLKTIFIKVFSNALKCTPNNPDIDIHFLKDVILANVRAIRKNKKIRIYYIYDELIKINKIINETNFTNVEEFIKNGYENKELMKNVFNSLYFNEENNYSIIKGSRIQQVFSKQDAEFYFMMNFAMGLEKSLDFFIKFKFSKKNEKTYYLLETLSNLANFLTQTEKNLNLDYLELCSTAVKISDIFKKNNISISENYLDTMDFLEDLKKATTIDFQKNYNEKNGKNLQSVNLFRQFCENKNLGSKKKGEAECLFAIFKDFTDFVKDQYQLMFV